MTARALIVDDSLTVRMDLVEAFQEAGFDTVPCATLAAARETLAAQPPTLVILDVVLPDGDGVEFLDELRASPRGGELPVILLSTEAEIKDRLRGLRSGADAYVGKPYDRLYLVARAHELVRARSQEAESEHGGGPMRVLVIDDSITFRNALGASLAAAGFTVLAAGTGEDGLRIAADARPDLIVVDGVLPGIDGATVIRRLRLDAALRAIPCVMLTGSHDRVSELAALDSGADAFLRKDEDVDVILARLGAIARREGRAGRAMRSVHGSTSVLVVDDSETFLQTLASDLRSDGHEVILARSGEEALELLGVQSVDCILLDVNMPGLDGLETCRQIKSTSPLRETSLVLMSAEDTRAAMLEGLAAGADDFIAKSSELDVVRSRVRAQLRRRQVEDESRRQREEVLAREIEATEARAARTLAAARSQHVDELQRKNRELEAFSYSVSHDLRAPLRAILGFCRELVDHHAGSLNEEGLAFLGRVTNNANRMDRLIDDLLGLSKVGSGEINPTWVDVPELASQIIAELRSRDPGRQVAVTIAPNLSVHGDRRLLEVVLENLLGNAWKFTGKVTTPRIEVGPVVDGSRIGLFVRDNGAGFDEAFADKMFRPFQRLHHESEFPGTGIGLATVQRIVERHGGRIWAQATVGGGATFSVALPQPGEEPS